MAGSGVSKSKSSNPTRVRKRVEVEPAPASASASASSSVVRAKDGSAFARCEECNKDVPVALISFHNCSLDAKIKMNLDSQVIENPPEVKKKATEKRRAQPTERKAKKAKNPNMPKRPPTAFFLFLEEFRKTYKEANPDCKSVATVAKEGGEKWKSFTDEEKKPYVERAAELKAEYQKALESNNDAENEDVQDEEVSSEKEVKVETISDDE
ncbi:unnamed protein product [Ilex paraguariensis]|uniref:HMG box domain-containing protein n=1 Tax=Ilex paraguariensis TaxID=185542 RepID=A0ABC8RFV1_9AQUA